MLCQRKGEQKQHNNEERATQVMASGDDGCDGGRDGTGGEEGAMRRGKGSSALGREKSEGGE